MFKLIKNGEVYNPDYYGTKDILLAANKICALGDRIEVPKGFVPIDIMDAKGMIITPGLIDAHVHICGGGGENGFPSRTPEIQLKELIQGGITTVVGCLGTDGYTRNMANLVAKAKALEEEGITTFVYMGSYEVLVKPLTNSIPEDLMLIDKIIGVGEVALSDHRSSQPTLEEMKKLSAQARIGGILSGKAGIVNIHVGDGPNKIEYIERIITETEIPRSQFLPTHMNRSWELFQQAIEYAKNGGYIDFTTSSPKPALDRDIKSSKALKIALDKGVSIDQITFTSDGQGSLPIYDENGNIQRLQVGKVTSLYEEIRRSIVQEKVPIGQALKVATRNPAKILKLRNKGNIEKGMDADMLIIGKKDLEIKGVISQGHIMMDQGKIIKKDFFSN